MSNRRFDKIDPITNEPIYKSRYDIEKFYETKSKFTYEYGDLNNDGPISSGMQPSLINNKILKFIWHCIF